MASIIPQLIPIEINQEKRRQMVLTNIIKMITERKLLSYNDLENNIKEILKEHKEDEIYNIKTNTGEIYMIVLLLNQKITSVTKHSVIGDYIHKDKNIHKIIVVDDINARPRQMVQSSFPKIEIFLEKELMFNIIDCIYVPKHEVLSKEEADSLLEEYTTKKSQLPYILLDDPVSRYYNMQPGQICRITRPSETTGYTHYYRIVVNRTINKK